MLPNELVNLIKTYLNFNNILLFNDLVDYYNQHSSQYGYFLDIATKRMNQENATFKANNPGLASEFVIEILTDEQGEQDKNNVVVQFDFRDIDYNKIDNMLIRNFVDKYYLNLDFYNKLNTAANVNSLFKDYNFPYALILYSNENYRRWGILV